jgi:galactonate dehydratase
MLRDDYARAGQVATSGIAVLELACWDVVGKALGQPVYRLFGGAVRNEVKAYANGWYTVERTPEEFRAAAVRVVDRGYRALKVDPFGHAWATLEPAELRHAVALVEAIRDGIGPDVDLLIEMHGRFTPATAVQAARELEPFRPGWIEEPVPPYNARALARVAERVSIRIATGERIHTRHEFREVLELQAADVIQPDVTMCCGLGETRKLAAWADVYSVQVAPHNVGGPVSTAAALHLAACTPNVEILEYFNDFDEPYVKQAAAGAPEVVDGFFSLPDAPGLGVALDEDVIAEHPKQELHFGLFSDDWHLRRAAAGTAS